METFIVRIHDFSVDYPSFQVTANSIETAKLIAKALFPDLEDWQYRVEHIAK